MSAIVLLTLPIGNLSDLSLRGKEALESGEVFICEDTRTLKSFMQLVGIEYSSKNFLSFHDHSSSSELDYLIKTIKSNELVYLVSDAGNPLISDPGYPLVKKCLDEGIEVKSIPGVSAILVALELSGLPPFPFYFYGFYPQEQNKQEELLLKLNTFKGTHLFFEGTSRIEKTINKLTKELPSKSFVIARELTKKFESIYRFKGEEWESVRSTIIFKGEFVLLVYNDQESMAANINLRQLAEEIVSKGAKPKMVSKLIAEILDRPAGVIYQELLKNNQQ